MRPRALLKGVVLAGLLGAIVMTTLWQMTWIAPSWYRPDNAAQPQSERLAETVENRLVEEAHKVRALDEPWTVRVRSDQVNAWLSNRLPRWLIHEQDVRWPEQLGSPQVRLSADGIDVGIVVSPEKSSRVIVLRVVPMLDDGKLWLKFDRLSLGRVPMPGYTLDDLVEIAGRYGADEALVEPETQWLLEVLAGRESLEPVATLADDRRVRLLEIRLDDDVMDLTLQTLAPQMNE